MLKLPLFILCILVYSSRSLSHTDVASFPKKIKAEMEKVLSSFNSLVNDVKGDISILSALQDVVTRLNSNYPGCQNLFTNSLNLHDLFARISKWYSFLDYGLIKYLVKHFGSHTTKVKMKKYEQRFCCFAKYQIRQCPCNIFDDIDTSELIYEVHLEQSLTTSTLFELAKLKSKLKAIIGCKLLHFLSVDDDVLYFRGFNFHITNNHHQKLRSLRILKIFSENRVIFSAGMFAFS